MSEHARDLLLRGRDAVLAKEREEARFYLEWVLSTDSDLDQQTEGVVLQIPVPTDAQRAAALAVVQTALTDRHMCDPETGGGHAA